MWWLWNRVYLALFRVKRYCVGVHLFQPWFPLHCRIPTVLEGVCTVQRRGGDRHDEFRSLGTPRTILVLFLAFPQECLKNKNTKKQKQKTTGIRLAPWYVKATYQLMVHPEAVGESLERLFAELRIHLAVCCHHSL